MQKKILSLILAMAMVLSMFVATHASVIEADTYVFNYELDISEGNIDITDGTNPDTYKVIYGNPQTEQDNIPQTQVITLLGTTDINTVTVSATEGTVKLKLNGMNTSKGMLLTSSDTRNVELTLADDTVNIIRDSLYNASPDTGGGLTITCEHADETGHLCDEHCGALAVYGPSGNGAAISGHNTTINGGNIYALGGNSSPGIGKYGGTVKNITINGGIISANGRSSYGTAGIGGGDISNADGIFITGGIIQAAGIKRGAGIGGGDIFYGNGGQAHNIIISGGTVVAKSGYDTAYDIGGVGSCSNIQINGGSVNANSIRIPPVNLNGENVYQTIITLEGVASATRVTTISLTGADYYNTDEIFTDTAGKIYFYLPEGASITGIVAGGNSYTGTITTTSDGLANETFALVDTVKPILTAGEVTRTSNSQATVKFISNEDGAYYYEVVNDGDPQPTIDTTGTGTNCSTSEVTINLALTYGAKDVYIVVKDAAGNVSNANFNIDIPAWGTHVPTAIFVGSAGYSTLLPMPGNHINAEGGNTASGDWWISNESGKYVLTLNNAHITSMYSVTEGHSAGIYADGALTIRLADGTTNSISNSTTSNYSFGISCEGILNVEGSGTLTIGNLAGTSATYGISCQGGLNIDGGTINIDIDQDTSGSGPVVRGISYLGEMNMNAGSLTIDVTSRIGWAIFASYNINLRGGNTSLIGSSSVVSYDDSGKFSYGGNTPVEVKYNTTASATDAMNYDGDPTNIPDTYKYLSVSYSVIPEQPSWTTGITSANQYPFGGGDGTSVGEAYEISTPEQLAQLAHNVNNGNDYSGKYFKLLNSLDLSGKEWTPIGYRFYPSYERGFNGTFDGNGYTINNITIGSSDEPKVGGDQTQAGLFGAIKYQAVLKNLHVDAYIYTDAVNEVGALVGYSESNDTITDCTAVGTIVSVGSGGVRIGGLIGSTAGTTVTNCSSDVDISAAGGNAIGGLIGYHGAFSYDRLRLLDGGLYTGNLAAGNVSVYGGVGGIVGQSYGYTLIVNSINSGNISGSDGNIGGIAGKIHNDIANCYSSGDVSGGGDYNTRIGGITGFIDSGKVHNCYNSGKVSTSGTALVGALVGYGSSGSVVSNGYFDGTVNPELAHVRSTGGNKYFLYEFTSAEMKGADPGTPIEYATGIFASGEGAFEEALNGWIQTQALYPGIDFSEWDTLHVFNNGYPYLIDVQELGIEHDATLAALSASGISLHPTFNRAVTNYSTSVAYSVNSITITAEPTNRLSTVTINGTAATTKEVALHVGNNTISIEVTAENGVTAEIYTATINRAENSSSGGDSSYTPPSIVVTTEKTTNSTINVAKVIGSITSGTAYINITPVIVDALLEKAVSTNGNGKGDIIKLAVDTPDSIDKLKVSLPQSSLNNIVTETDAKFTIASPFISITFDNKALETINAVENGGTVIITAGAVDKNVLSEQERTQVEGRPVYDLTVMNGDKQVSDFGTGYATVSIPYTLMPDENPNAIVVYCLADDNTLKTVRGYYDAGTKTVVFKTTHFSKFVISYNFVAFDDVSTGAWYKNAVEFIAARGITTGTGDNKFSPNAKLTRAQFVVLLMNAYQIKLHESGHIQNFTDAGNTYYTDYLLAAKGLGIVNGVGNNLFTPEKEITRQEMFVMLHNALKVIDETPIATLDIQLTSFNDSALVASWAREALSSLVRAGVVGGSNNNLNPTSGTTRAEIAQVLYNLLSN